MWDFQVELTRRPADIRLFWLLCSWQLQLLLTMIFTSGLICRLRSSFWDLAEAYEEARRPTYRFLHFSSGSSFELNILA